MDRLMKEHSTQHLLLHCTFYLDHFKQWTPYKAKLKREIPLFLLNSTLMASLDARSLQRAAIKDCLETVYSLHTIRVCLESAGLSDGNFISHVHCMFLSSMAEVFAQTRSGRTLANWKYFTFSDSFSFSSQQIFCLAEDESGTKHNYIHSYCLWTPRVFIFHLIVENGFFQFNIIFLILIQVSNLYLLRNGS